MSTLATYLWKEWRDQRATVFGILAVQLLTCICLVVFLQDTVFGSTAMVSAISLGSIALTLVAFGPELIAGENQAGTLGFLCRMPRGLQWAFCAKMLFLLAQLERFGGNLSDFGGCDRRSRQAFGECRRSALANPM